MRFDKVMLMGSGKVACDCMEYLVTFVCPDDLMVLETSENALSVLEKRCRNKGLMYKGIPQGV